MMDAIARTALALLLALAAMPVRAAEAAPDALLAAVTSDVIAAIRHNRDHESPGRLTDLVETRVLPLFNFSRMTQLAMGRNWRLATAEQQTALAVEFRRLLVRTYSTALAGYRDQKIEFKRLRSAPGDTEVTVKSDVSGGSERVSIDYDMEKTPLGWQVFDVKIDGVSLVTAYREGFAARVRSDGVDGLLKALADKNRQSDAAPRPVVAATERSRLVNALVRSALRQGG